MSICIYIYTYVYIRISIYICTVPVIYSLSLKNSDKTKSRGVDCYRANRARGQRRGFSPGAAARHPPSAAAHRAKNSPKIGLILDGL